MELVRRLLFFRAVEFLESIWLGGGCGQGPRAVDSPQGWLRVATCARNSYGGNESIAESDGVYFPWEKCLPTVRASAYLESNDMQHRYGIQSHADA